MHMYLYVEWRQTESSVRCCDIAFETECVGLTILATETAKTCGTSSHNNYHVSSCAKVIIILLRVSKAKIVLPSASLVRSHNLWLLQWWLKASSLPYRKRILQNMIDCSKYSHETTKHDARERQLDVSSQANSLFIVQWTNLHYMSSRIERCQK